MTYGLQLFSDENKLLFSSDLPNYRYVGKKTTNQYYGNGFWTCWTYMTITSVETPQFFITNVNVNESVAGSTIGFSTIIGVVKGMPVNVTSNNSSPQTVIPVSSVVGLTVGDTLSQFFNGGTVPTSTITITAINAGTNQITLSSAIRVVAANIPLVFYNSSRPNEWSCIVGVGRVKQNTNVTDSINIYAFSPSYTEQTSGYGIQLYDETGTVIMNTQNKLLSISGYAISPNVPITNIPSSPTEFGTTTLNNGSIASSYAHNCSAPGYFLQTFIVLFALNIHSFIGVRKNSNTTFSFYASTAFYIAATASVYNFYSVMPNRVIQFIDTTLYD